ncbi:MAG: heterodisulfide reductase-related iron-sulfur binding cluster [Salinivirgaceae bacterium]|jgi:heterodisulfide reductase subunit B|nr:heterodisulfide reductase subunit B [Bacteroidales bacterium]
MSKEKRDIWRKYQKSIGDDNFFFVRSCIRQNFFPASEQAFLHILRNELGKNVVEDARHTTCSGIGYHSDVVNFDTLQTIIARHFALMTEAKLKNVAISCVTSFGLYSEVLETWKEFPSELEKTRENLYKATKREFEIPENIAHCSDIIYKFREEIKNKGKNRLVNAETGEPLKIVDHIGCHYAKIFPEYGEGGAEFPQVLTGMIESWGGQTVDYPERRHCCGFGFRQYLVQANRGYSVSNTYKKLQSMEPYKPDMIIANCPGCTMFIDKWQYTISEMEHKTFGPDKTGIPVLTYEELAGLVLGYDPWDLGLQMHQVSAEPLLDKMGIKYDKDKKFADKSGKIFSIPKQPEYIL